MVISVFAYRLTVAGRNDALAAVINVICISLRLTVRPASTLCRIIINRRQLIENRLRFTNIYDNQLITSFHRRDAFDARG